jgi:hypothetical protein
MNRKDKYNHRKGGKIVTTNLYDEIIPLNDLLARKEEEQVRYLTEYRKRFTNKQLTEAWGKYDNYVYTLMDKLGMRPKTGKRKGNSGKKNNQGQDPVPVPAYIVNTHELPVPNQSAAIEDEEGFAFKISGKFTSDKLIKRLEKLALILSDEEAEFEVKLLIKEKN